MDNSFLHAGPIHPCPRARSSCYYNNFGYELLIFDRWGELIFQSRDHLLGWNGQVRGQVAQLGVYVWKLFYKDPQAPGVQELTGHVTLVK